MEITTFAGGLVTNVAEHAPRRRESYATYCRNCRSDEQGWLVRRDGMTRISDETGITAVFAHKSVVLAVINSKLKWARVSSIGSQLSFQDIDDGVNILLLQGGRAIFSARDDKVYVMTGIAPIVINVPDPPHEPTAEHFYLSKPETPSVTTVVGGKTDGDDFSSRHIKLRLQSVSLSESQEVLEDHQGAFPGQRTSDVFDLLADKSVVSEPSESVRLLIATDDNDAFNDLDEAEALIARTTIDIALSETPDTGTYVDVYRSLRDVTPDDELSEGWYWMARFPAGETTLRYTFEMTDYSVSGYPELLHIGEDKPHLQYLTTNEFRSYAAGLKSKRVWLSYYDPGKNEKLYQNLTDFIDLDLGEGYITGLKFIRDNLLIVYATNQIQVIATDPLSELHSVIDFISPQDDVGNPIGCVAPESIVDMGGEHFFLASNRYVYRFNSRTARTISDSVQAIFDAIALPLTEMGEPDLSRAVAFAYQKDYFISIPSKLEENSDEFNNTTLLYDTQYGRWWQDTYAVRSISKGYPERIYAVIDNNLFELFLGDTDDGVRIRRVWRSNPELRRTHDKFRSVHVYAMGAAIIEVLAKTEQGEERGTITIEETSDVFSQRLGVNLRGRNFTVEVATENDAPIDRIATNELFRS